MAFRKCVGHPKSDRPGPLLVAGYAAYDEIVKRYALP